MADFLDWCVETETENDVGEHDLTLLKTKKGGFEIGLAKIAAVMPDHYASETRLAGILEKLGKPAAAEYLAQKMPTGKKPRSGDVGEILAVSYIEERTIFDKSVDKLRWKDSREMALRGDDMLAVGITKKGKMLFLKGESKSRLKLSNSPIEDARKSLNVYDGLPNPHSLGFLADRFSDDGRTDIADQIDAIMLTSGVKAKDVTHMIFTFSGNDPETYLTTDLTNYDGAIDQRSVGLRISDHQEFIAGVYEKVLSDGDT